MRLVDADLIEKQFDHNTWQGEMMIAIARGLPTVNEWIPCSERLPEDSGVYLVQFTYKPATDNTWCEVIHFQHKCKKWKRLNNLAIAWMPLPEMYDK